MRFSVTPIVILSLVGSFHILSSAIVVPTSGVSVDTLGNRGLPPIKGGGDKSGKGGNNGKDEPDFPVGGSIAGGSSGSTVPAGSWGGLASGANRPTREKGTIKENIPNVRVIEDKDFPLVSESGGGSKGNWEYLTGIVHADKEWTFNRVFDMSKEDGYEFFAYAVSSQERAILVRGAYTKIEDNPAADAARTYKTRDILMDGWIKEAESTGTQVSSLKFVIRDDITTTESREAIEMALTTAGRDRSVKAEFSVNVPGDKVAFDILTTGNIHGNGITKMVQLNHADLADMQIIKVTAWTPSTKGLTYYSLAFELGTV